MVTMESVKQEIDAVRAMPGKTKFLDSTKAAVLALTDQHGIKPTCEALGLNSSQPYLWRQQIEQAEIDAVRNGTAIEAQGETESTTEESSATGLPEREIALEIQLPGGAVILFFK
jgi:transposase-like protein